MTETSQVCQLVKELLYIVGEHNDVHEMASCVEDKLETVMSYAVDTIEEDKSLPPYSILQIVMSCNAKN